MKQQNNKYEDKLRNKINSLESYFSDNLDEKFDEDFKTALYKRFAIKPIGYNWKRKVNRPFEFPRYIPETRQKFRELSA